MNQIKDCVIYPSKTEFNNQNHQQSNSNFLSDSSSSESLRLVRCNFWSSVGQKFADLVSNGIIITSDEGCDSIFNHTSNDYNSNIKTSSEGIQIHFILHHRTEGYCKILYTKKVNIIKFNPMFF